jgi:radical SAM superfamily enzyme YgiQ (UPF0313 family)
MPKVVLVPAPSVGPDGRMRRYLPLGLLSLRALAGRGPAEVDLSLPGDDLTRTRYRSSAELVADLASALPDLGGFDTVGLATMCSSFHHTLRLAREIKSRAPDLAVWLGGPHVSVVASEALHAFPDLIDAVFVGEGEGAFSEALARGRGGDIEGVMTRAGELVPRPPLVDLDELPFIRLGEPELDVLRWQATERSAPVTIPFEVARGCPGRCTFCSTRRFWGRKVRRKSLGRIIEQMRRYHDETGVRRFEIMGDNLSASLPWLRKLCAALARDAPEMRWQADLKLDRMSGGDLDLLWRGGCRGFFVGVESGSQATLDRVRKGVDLDREVRLIDQALHHGFEVKTSLIVGFPWETAGDVDRTFRLHCELLEKGVSQSQVWLLCPLPGTDLLTEHEPRFDRLGSRIAMDGVPLDADTREMARRHPGLFAQLGRFDAPRLAPLDVDATVATASQLTALYARTRQAPADGVDES